MKIIVCVDDNLGMLFNNRRQSRDQVLVEDILKRGEKLWIHSFSEKLFEGQEDRVIIDDDFLSKAGASDVCFVENQPLMSHIDKVEELIVYKWNRKYPSDFTLDIDLMNWKMTSQEEFVGKSHEKITRETYVAFGCKNQNRMV